MSRPAFLLALLALLLPTVASASEGFIEPKEKNGPVVHRYSGFSFPARIGGFHRLDPHQFDAAGYDVSVGYNLDFPQVTVTIYVYPAGAASVEQEFARRQQEITGAHPAARLAARGTTTVSPKKIRVSSAEYTYTEKFASEVQPLRSILLVGRRGAHFVEYRISFPAANEPVSRKLIRQLTQDFAWP